MANSKSNNKTYAISGGASGIGAALAQSLRERGDRVLVIDLKNADVEVDLASSTGRQHALAQIGQLAPDGLDGWIPCAGLGPHSQPLELITRVNYFAAWQLTEGLKPLLAKKNGTVVMISSNSASLPGYHQGYLDALAHNDEQLACSIIATLDGQTAYGGSKYALAVWMRKQAPAFMKAGVRMNAVAPGITGTAMTDGVFQDKQWGAAIQQFSQMTPCGKIATPHMIANAILFLLDPASEFVCGSVLFVDGGTDALLRPTGF